MSVGVFVVLMIFIKGNTSAVFPDGYRSINFCSVVFKFWYKLFIQGNLGACRRRIFYEAIIEFIALHVWIRKACCFQKGKE